MPQLNLFRLKRENKPNEDRTSRDIGNISDHREEDYYKPVRVGNYIILNIKAKVIEKHYQLKNILIKINYT